jgi:hypothetical protein
MGYYDRKAQHERLREKLYTAYVRIPLDNIYFNSRSAIEFNWKAEVEENGERRTEPRRMSIDPVSSSAIVNALVPKSGVIYCGGHGGGKTTLMEKVGHMLTGIPEGDIREAIIRGNDGHSYNTLVAMTHLGKMLKEGDIDTVRWQKFVTCPFKGIDELNRFPPEVQNYLFDGLNKGRFQDIVSGKMHQLEDYILFATENPNDPGTYPLSRPFLDRFAFCVPAPQLPSIVDQDLLADRYDDKLRDIKARTLMNMDELRQARRMISEDVKLSSQAAVYTIYLTQWLSSCERGDFADKSHNDIEVGERCKDCHLEAKKLCSATKNGVSGRAYYDFVRWGKAYGWFLNLLTTEKDVERDGKRVRIPIEPEVPHHVIEAIAPYLIYHRVEPTDRYFTKAPYFGQRMKYLQDLIGRVNNEFGTCQNILREEVTAILKGRLPYAQSKLKELPDKDIVVTSFFKPLAEEAGKKSFRDLYDRIQAVTPAQLQGLDPTERARASLEARSRAEGLAKDILLRSGDLKPIAQMFLLSKAKSRLGISDEEGVPPGVAGVAELEDKTPG